MTWTALRLDAPAPLEIVYVSLNAAGEMIETAHQALKERCAGLEMEIAKLTAQVAIAQSKVNELSFVSERLRVENKGPQGLPGPMGRDGHAGAPGARGERGAAGRAGAPGPRIIGWECDDSSFVAVPLLSDGRKGAASHLRGMFESCNAQVEAGEVAEEIDAATASREATEREAQAARQGRR